MLALLITLASIAVYVIGYAAVIRIGTVYQEKSIGRQSHHFDDRMFGVRAVAVLWPVAALPCGAVFLMRELTKKVEAKPTRNEKRMVEWETARQELVKTLEDLSVSKNENDKAMFKILRDSYYTTYPGVVRESWSHEKTWPEGKPKASATKSDYFKATGR